MNVRDLDLILKARNVREGDIIHLIYEKPVRMKKEWQGETIFKRSEITLKYDPTNYFQKNMEHYGTHLEAAHPPVYEKVEGTLDQHLHTKEYYIRFSFNKRKKSLVEEKEPVYIFEGEEIPFEELPVQYIYSDEWPNQKSATRQKTAAGKDARDIEQKTYKLENVVFLEITKGAE